MNDIDTLPCAYDPYDYKKLASEKKVVLIINADRKYLLRAIRKHCIKCMGNQKAVRVCQSVECDLWPVRMRPSQHKDVQTNLFRVTDSDEFFDMCMEELKRMPDVFWWSDFRQRVKAYPLSHNTWGAVAKRLNKLGYKQTGNRRKSPITSTKGTQEYEYSRI